MFKQKSTIGGYILLGKFWQDPISLQKQRPMDRSHGPYSEGTTTAPD